MGNAAIILWPVILQAFLTFCGYLVLGRRRFGSVKRGEARLKEYKFGGGGPERVQLASRHVANQFELPVLFYAVVAFALITGEVSAYLVVLAWLFVASRYVHAFGHLQDILKPRLYGFFASLFFCFLMWLGLAIQISLPQV